MKYYRVQLDIGGELYQQVVVAASTSQRAIELARESIQYPEPVWYADEMTEQEIEEYLV